MRETLHLDRKIAPFPRRNRRGAFSSTACVYIVTENFAASRQRERTCTSFEIAFDHSDHFARSSVNFDQVRCDKSVYACEFQLRSAPSTLIRRLNLDSRSSSAMDGCLPTLRRTFLARKRQMIRTMGIIVDSLDHASR